MKRLLSYFFAVCVSLSLLTAFSFTANAEQLDGYSIRQDVSVFHTETNTPYANFLDFTPNDGVTTKFEETWSESRLYITNQDRAITVFNIFAPVDGYPFVLHKENRIRLENFYYRILIDAPTGIRYTNYTDDMYLLISYVDGTTERLEVDATKDSDMSMDITTSFKPTENVSRFDLYLVTYLRPLVKNEDYSSTCNFTFYYGEVKGDNKYNFNIEIQSEEAGLLSGILGWIQNIWNKTSDTFDKLTELGSYILELPSKIWNFISDGLQYLFIPSEESITEFKSKMDTLLENKLGAVYQVSNLVIESWEDIQESDATDSIEIPATTIYLPDRNKFTFGGYDVKIVPDGFTTVANSLKTIVGIVCTIAFVNGLRKRYEEVMGVVQ